MSLLQPQVWSSPLVIIININIINIIIIIIIVIIIIIIIIIIVIIIIIIIIIIIPRIEFWKRQTFLVVVLLEVKGIFHIWATPKSVPTKCRIADL